MPSTTLEPRRSPHQTHDERLDNKISSHTTAHELNGQAKTMEAIVQDQYGSTHVLKLQDVDMPAIGVDDVLVHL